MKAIGIICEYNPFHNGHLYHLNTIKEKYPDYIIVLVMSGHFMERGDVSIIDKWKRSQIALKLGVDLVIELPYPFASQSADFFAYGAVTLLEKLQVEKVIFGSEGNSIEDLECIANAQLNNPEFDSLVHFYSKMGKNYPTALSLALEDLTHKKITTPNDLLGISYIKEILKNHYHLGYEVIERINNYHSKELTTISSASAIREALKNKKSIKGTVPDITLSYLDKIRFLDDYFPFIKYKLLSDDDLSIYQTVDEGIDALLKSKIENANSLDEFINLIKSKRYTYNKITRMLIHILCGFTKEMAKDMKTITYIRLLGFNIKGRKYLNQIKKNIDIPIISKITREKDKMLEFEIHTTKIYDLVESDNLKNNEFNKILFIGDDKND